MDERDILFEFSHPERLRILELLKKEELKLSSISNKLSITTAEVSRHLERLTNVKVIEKSSNGEYFISMFGTIVLNQISNINYLNENRDFFLKHDLQSLPSSITCFKALSRSKVKNGTLDNVGLIKEVIERAEKYLHVISNQESRLFKEAILETAERGIEVTRIYSKPEVIPEEIKKAKNIDVRIIDDIHFDMGVSDIMGGLTLPNTLGVMDYEQIFVGDDAVFITWLNNIVKYCKSKSRPI